MAEDMAMDWHPLNTMGAAMAGGGGKGVRLTVLPNRAQLTLRGRMADRGFAEAIAAALGAPPPVDANTWIAGSDGWRLIWLGPDEWLAMGPDGAQDAMEATLRAAQPDDPWAAITDTSHTMTGLGLSGPAARDVLAAGCALDLHPRAFGPGRSAQTHLAKTRMLFLQTGDDPTYEIWVRNSFARYTAEWLIDAIGLL